MASGASWRLLAEPEIVSCEEGFESVKSSLLKCVLISLTFLCPFAAAKEVRAEVLQFDSAPKKDSRGRYQIAVLTYGPGTHVFTKFGHNAVWVTDRLTGEEQFYNFGTLDFKSKSLIADFLKGRLRYWVSVTNRRGALRSYSANDRSASAQILDLRAQKAEEFVQKLRTSALPENRFYVYDYFQDNCSTRVRDLLDEAVDGELRATSTEPAQWTWREHTMRLSQSDLGVSLGSHLVLGPHVDTRNTRWEEMFLPSVLQATLRRVQIGEGTDRRPLVQREFSVLDSTRPDVPTSPPSRWPSMLLSGTAFGGVCLLLSRKSAGLRGRAILSKILLSGLGVLTLLWGLVSGILGSLLLFFWLGTDHEIAFRNQNILLFSPLALLLPPLLLTLPMWRLAPRLIFLVSVGCAVSATLGFLIRLSPLPFQDTNDFVAFTLPVWWGLSLAWAVQRPPRRTGVNARQ
jgi:hypothetical protein